MSDENEDEIYVDDRPAIIKDNWPNVFRCRMELVGEITKKWYAGCFGWDPEKYTENVERYLRNLYPDLEQGGVEAFAWIAWIATPQEVIDALKEKGVDNS